MYVCIYITNTYKFTYTLYCIHLYIRSYTHVNIGRFDRRIVVDLPDFKGRVAILGVHSKNKPLEADVDLEQIARRTPGFSGASLANLMNEAAIFAARKNKAEIGNEQISDALDRVTLGPEKKNAEATVQKRVFVKVLCSGFVQYMYKGTELSECVAGANWLPITRPDTLSLVPSSPTTIRCCARVYSECTIV